MQPDSLIPDPSNPQAWNRYAYARNNPIRYNDPTGHSPVCVMGGPKGSCLAWAGLTGSNAASGYEKFSNDDEANLDRYGVKLVDGTGNLNEYSGTNWTTRNTRAALMAIVSIAGQMEANSEKGGVEEFRTSFNTSSENPLVMVMGTSASGIYLGDGSDSKSCANIGSGGCTVNSHTINFASLYPKGYFSSAVNNIIHELGHAFNDGRGSNPMNAMPDIYVRQRGEILLPTINITYQQNIDPTSSSETFADFFVAWTLNKWRTDTDISGPASTWMNSSMKEWLP